MCGPNGRRHEQRRDVEPLHYRGRHRPEATDRVDPEASRSQDYEVGAMLPGVLRDARRRRFIDCGRTLDVDSSPDARLLTHAVQLLVQLA